jgi:hypothetical protein
MTSSLRHAALPVLVLSMLFSQRALARTVTITITGTVASGTDVSGVFGKPGSQLSGRFTLVFTFDDSTGDKQPLDCKGTPPYSPHICSSGISGPGQRSPGTATLQIGDSAPFQFGVPVEDVTSSASRITWTSPISSYKITLGVGDGYTMVAGSIGPATPKPVPPMSASQVPPASAAWDYPISDSTASSSPGISFVIDRPGAKAFGLLDGTTICVGNSCGAAPVRAFFSIAYANLSKDASRSFVRAAATWRNEIKASYSFREGHDLFIEKTVQTATDFIAAWNDIATIGSKDGHVIVEGAIFSHASLSVLRPDEEGIILRYVDKIILQKRQDSTLYNDLFVLEEIYKYLQHLLLADTGLEFAEDPLLKNPPGKPFQAGEPTGGTITQEMIRLLPKLHWDKSAGKLTLFGCNTAELRGIPPWNPAALFAEQQKVNTWGQIGFSIPSADKSVYVKIDENPSSSQNVYLGAYWVGLSNAAWPPDWLALPFAYGRRMPMAQFP